MTCFAKLTDYLLADGYSIDFSENEPRHATTRYNILFSVARFAVNHLTNTHLPYTGTRYVSKKGAEALINIWMPMKQFTPLIFHKMQHGSVYTAVIIDADEFSSSAIREVISTADQNGLNSRQCAMHISQMFFIKQQAGGVFIELFFVFSDSGKAKKFCAQHLEECTRIHRWKKTYVNACVINVSDSDVISNKRPRLLFQGNRGKKLRKELFA